MANDVEKAGLLADIDTMHDVYMSRAQREAYDRIKAAALTQPAASGEAVGYATPDGLAELAADRCSATMFGNYSERYGRTVPLYATPQPDADTVRDAARYRFIAADHSAAWEEELDAAIDSAIKGEKA